MNVQIMKAAVRTGETKAGRKPEKESQGDFLSILKEQSKSRGDEPVKKTEKTAEKTKKQEPPKDQREAESLSGQTNLDNRNNQDENRVAEKPDESNNVAEKGTEPQQDSIITAVSYFQMAGEIISGNAEEKSRLVPDSSQEIKNSALENVRQQAVLQNVTDNRTTEGQQTDITAAAANGKENFPAELENRVKQPSANNGYRELKETAVSKEPQPIFEKAVMAGTQTENSEGQTENSTKEGNEFTKWFSLDHAAPGEKVRESGESEEKQGAVTLEDLQKKAEQQSFLPFERMVGAKLSGGTAAPVMSNRGVTDATPLTNQLKTGIEEGLSKQLNQFTIRLKPEGLGEILVHMTSSGGKVALSIGVSNLDTQKLLSSEMMHLKESLQPLNAEVQEIYHNSQGGMEMMNYEQGFFRNQQGNGAGNTRRHFAGNGEEEEGEEDRLTGTIDLHAEYGRLSAYI
ncbi:flagellar hook-length control protein FliK [Clostridium transplantifaecale]|uniref:flagellar hook-length control protein FliK n=1 Tax=Clostridium transplantifaecale TaxID=2479838 RepID=UPI000F642179|nr:flagellar hook-length control protein FliK [Clostridium transplantifaecale]